jgi:hypothetical protein
MKSQIAVFALLCSLSLASQATMFAQLQSQLKTATNTAGVFDTVLDMIYALRQ